VLFKGRLRKDFKKANFYSSGGEGLECIFTTPFPPPPHLFLVFSRGHISFKVLFLILEENVTRTRTSSMFYE
jgi:hypothetical protein